MPGTDDLAPLFVAGQGSGDVGFRQGTVLAWDETNGTNTVDVGGAHLTDLPALNIGDFVHLAEGDVVGLLRFKTTYFILGRVILPRAPDPNRASLAAEAKGAQGDGWSTTTTLTAKCSVTLTPPDWCDEADVMVGQMGQGINSTGSQDYLELHPRVAGVTLNGMVGGAGPAGSGFATVVASTTVANPGTSLLVEGLVRSQFGSWAANASNSTNISVMALYRRID